MYKKFLLVQITFLLCVTALSQEIKIWKGASLKVYTPTEFSNGGAIIVCPGGSYKYLGKHIEGYKIAEKLVKDGFTVFVLKYRVALAGYHYPAMIQDLQRSIQYVKENALQYNIDSSNVGLIGFSAGGHLVGVGAKYYKENFISMLNNANNAVSLRPSYAVMMYPVITMYEPYVHKRSRRNLLGKNPSDLLIEKMSLEKNLSSDIPPLLIMQAKDDKTVDYHNSVLMQQALDEVGAEYEFHLFETGGHGFGAKPKIKTDMSRWYNIFLEWYNSINNSHEQIQTRNRISIQRGN